MTTKKNNCARCGVLINETLEYEPFCEECERRLEMMDRFRQEDEDVYLIYGEESEVEV